MYEQYSPIKMWLRIKQKTLKKAANDIQYESLTTPSTMSLRPVQHFEIPCSNSNYLSLSHKCPGNLIW